MEGEQGAHPEHEAEAREEQEEAQELPLGEGAEDGAGPREQEDEGEANDFPRGGLIAGSVSLQAGFRIARNRMHSRCYSGLMPRLFLLTRTPADIKLC